MNSTDFFKVDFISCTNDVFRIEINTQKQLLFIGCESGKITLLEWNILGSTISFESYVENSLEYLHYIWYSAFSPNGKYLYTGDDSGKIVKWDVEKKMKIHEFEKNKDTRCLIIYNNYFISSSEDQFLIFWDLETNEKKHSFKLAVFTKMYLNGDELIILKQDGELMIMNLNNFEIISVQSFPNESKALWSFLIMKNGDYLVGDDVGNIFQYKRGSDDSPYLIHKDESKKRFSHLMYFRSEIVSIGMSQCLKFHDPISLEVLRSYDTGSSTTTLVNISDKIFLTCGVNSNQIKIFHLREIPKIVELFDKKKKMDVYFHFCNE
jgi:WD40 repeat protein